MYFYNAAGKPVADLAQTGFASDKNTAVMDVRKFAPGVYYYLIRATAVSGRDIKFRTGKFLIVK